MKLLMITGLGSAVNLASDKKGAFYYTLEEFHNYWDRIDIISPRVRGQASGVRNIFGNVFIHISPWPLIFHPIWFLKKSLEIYREQKFNLMTVQEFPPFYNGIGAGILWAITKVPYVLEIHHILGYPRAASFKEFLYKFLTRIFVKFDSANAGMVRVVNQKQTPSFLIGAGVKKNKIRYIPSLYIDLDIFKPQDIAKEFDVISVGRLDKNKGLNLLLEAVKILKNRGLKLKVLIVGEGPENEKLQAHTTKYMLHDTIEFYGWAKDQEDIAMLMNKAKILAMLSYNEGGPRVVVEAMACGVPVVATRVGIVEDIWKEGAVSVVDWKPDNIAQAIKDLLNNPDKYDLYRSAGLKIPQSFDKKSVIKNFAEEIKELVQ